MKILVSLLTIMMPLAAQDQSRQIWDDYFGASRPAAPSAKPPEKPSYRPVPSPAPSQSFKPSRAPSGSSTALGITIWKMQSTGKSDSARLLVQEAANSNTVQLTPHRLQANEPLKPGDLVRLSIEAPASGYVYVIDQELYNGGKMGAPYLIFPTTRTRGGDNRIRPGQLIEIPAQTDAPNVFTISPKKDGYRGDKLLIVLASQPLQDLKPADREQEISAASFQAWMSRWNVQSQEFDLAGGEGRPWTEAEKDSGATKSRLLTQGDPPPQTIFVFPDSSGKPVIASVQLTMRQ